MQSSNSDSNSFIFWLETDHQQCLPVRNVRSASSRLPRCLK